jgi:hypothetical protein
MTDPTTLLALAERCEQAVGVDQKAVMLAVVDALKLPSKQHYSIIRMIEVGAYESAAIALVPAGHEWLRKNGQCMTVYRVPADLKEWARHIDARGATLALALCAAALRARAAAYD